MPNSAPRFAAPPKRLDPQLWIEARREWSAAPEMTFVDIAERLGVAVPTVSLRAKRELWTKADAVNLERIDVTPMQMVETAVRALMRAASQTKDLPTAVKAAGMLLDRTMGRVVTEAKPMLTPEASEPEERTVPMEEWQSARRFLYPEAIAAGQPPLPD